MQRKAKRREKLEAKRKHDKENNVSEVQQSTKGGEKEEEEKE